MKNTSLTRSIPFWLLLVLSLASAAVGAWFVTDQSTAMATALLDGTATGVEVYVGQPLIVVGGVLLGAGVIGILIALGLGAAKSLLPAAAPVVVEPIDWTAQNDALSEDRAQSPVAEETVADETVANETVVDEAVAENEADLDDETQNGSSGSIAIETNSNER